MSQFEKNLRPDSFRLYPRPTFLLMYKEPHSNYSRHQFPSRSVDLRKDNSLSRNSSMKMRRAITWLVSAAEIKKVFEKKYKRKVDWRINFITLTLPRQGFKDDRQIKRLLNLWFKWAIYNYGMTNYVWKAEVQQRGDLHFHIISDCYIHHSNIRFAWNRILRNHNLLGGHENPNSIDVHAVIDERIKNLTAYAIDYMQKKEKDEAGEQRRVIKGRLWGCSSKLSKVGKKYMPLDDDEARQVHELFKAAEWKIEQVKDISCFMYICPHSRNPYSYIDKNDEIVSIYNSELSYIRSKNVQLTMFERTLDYLNFTI